VQYTKATACPGFIAMVGDGSEQEGRMAQAQQEEGLLRQVYNSQRDGGETEELKDYVYDPAHSSSDVRSALMLHAPKVSQDTWKEVFRREPSMNPWHLAQALVANSPLQPEVVRLMEESELTPFYKQLVYGAQTGGVSSLTILESEMAHWKYEHARALNELASAAIRGDDHLTIADAMAFEAQYPEMGTPWARISMLIAQGDLLAAKAIVDELNAIPEPEGAMEVLGMALALELSNTPLAEAPQATLDRLEILANGEGTGMFAAQAWLRSLDATLYPERILLPVELRSSFTYQEPTEEQVVDIALLSVYPNPSGGQQAVFVVTRLQEGMESGEVRVFDPMGRQVVVERIMGHSAIVEVPVNGLANGLYIAALYADGLQVGITKFELTNR
jgi:hypothetical protein